MNAHVNDGSFGPPDTAPGWTRWRGWPYVIVGLTVVLRLVHIWNSRTNPTFWAPAIDPAWYDQAALNILQGDWGPFPLFRAPLYPALLAGVYGLFGHDLIAARVLNVALQAATAWGLLRIGSAYMGARTGIVAGLLFAVNGTAIYYGGEILSSSAELLAAVFCLWSVLRLLRNPGYDAVAVCGLAWGLAAVTRPNFLMLFPVVMAMALLLVRRHRVARSSSDPLRTLCTGLVWLAAAFTPILPVTAANWILGGEPVLIATQGGVNFWIGNNPESTGILSVLPGYGNTWTMEDAQLEADREAGRPLDTGELSTFYFKKGWSFLLAHPWESTRLMIRKSALFFNRFEISNNKHILYFAALSPWLPALLWLNFGLLIPLAVLGCFVLWRRIETKFMLVLILTYAASVILFFVTARFRLPVVPWVTLLAAGGAVWLADAIREKRAAGLLPALSAFAAGALLAHINLWNLTEAPLGWARYMEANAYLKLNQLDSARAGFEDTVADGHALPLALLNLGVVAIRQGDTARAQMCYEASLSYDDGNADAWNNMGTIHESRGDTAEAIAAYKHALTLRPTAPDPRHNLAGLYFRAGVAALKAEQDSAAAVYLNYCAALEPTPAGSYNLAVAFMRLGQHTRALSALEEALRMDPQLTPALQLRAHLRNLPPAD